jgi:hypothetical protein
MTRIAIIAVALTVLAGTVGAAPSWGVKFKVRRIGHVRTEACAVADFNNKSEGTDPSYVKDA